MQAPVFYEDGHCSLYKLLLCLFVDQDAIIFDKMSISPPGPFQKLRHVYLPVGTSSYRVIPLPLLCPFDLPPGHQLFFVFLLAVLSHHISFFCCPLSAIIFSPTSLVLWPFWPSIYPTSSFVLGLCLLSATIFYPLSFVLSPPSFIWDRVSDFADFLSRGSAFHAFPNRFFFLIDRLLSVIMLSFFLFFSFIFKRWQISSPKTK